MINLIKILGTLILFINICIQGNVTVNTTALTNEFEFIKFNQEKISNEFLLDFFKESQLAKMIRNFRKDVKKPKQKCIMFKMSVCILRVPVKPK